MVRWRQQRSMANNTSMIRRKTKFDRAAARKRLLEARYLGWTIHGSHGPSLIGRAGERVAHASLEGAAALSLPNRHYMLVPRSAQGVKMLLNERMDGPLDDAAYLTVISNGMPYAMTVPIEVKNVRHRLYPRAHEIYQLIRKASLLQAKHPEAPVLPVLICRRKHYLLHSMAVDLGFFVFETRIQPILPHSEVSPADVEEVRSVLGYNLMIMDNSLGELVTWFKDTLPKFGVKTSAQWQKSAPVLHALESAVRQLGDPSLRESDRTRVLAELQRHLITELGLAGAWVAKEAQRLESELSDEDYDDF